MFQLGSILEGNLKNQDRSSLLLTCHRQGTRLLDRGPHPHTMRALHPRPRRTSPANHPRLLARHTFHLVSRNSHHTHQVSRPIPQANLVTNQASPPNQSNHPNRHSLTTNLVNQHSQHTSRVSQDTSPANLDTNRASPLNRATNPANQLLHHTNLVNRHHQVTTLLYTNHSNQNSLRNQTGQKAPQRLSLMMTTTGILLTFTPSL